MSRREKEKQEALGKLARFATSAPSAPPPARAPSRPSPARAPSVPRAQPPAPTAARPRPSSTPARADPAAAARARAVKLADRKAKLEEERGLKQRRANEIARGTNLPWRGMDSMGVPASIRRTGFDRTEATTAQKIQDVLGEVKEKDGRAKARAKGKRQGGK